MVQNSRGAGYDKTAPDTATNSGGRIVLSIFLSLSIVLSVYRSLTRTPRNQHAPTHTQTSGSCHLYIRCVINTLIRFVVVVVVVVVRSYYTQTRNVT